MSLNFSSKYQCAACGDDIYSTSLLRVSCCDCPPGLDLCLECFSCRAEVAQHRPDHRYRFLDNGDFSPLGNDWSAKELLQLLEGLEQFGHGNWNDVARYVETKSAAECREAVDATFVSGPIGAVSWVEGERGRARDHTAPAAAAPGPGQQSHLSLHQLIVLGFMPARDDFEMEFENEAEVLVSGLAAQAGASRTDPEEEELETSLKLAQVEMYQSKLKERDRRKRVSRELGLVENFFKENTYNALTGKFVLQKPKKKDPKTEVIDRLKFVSSFLGAEEHRRMMASLTKEREIKSRIKELIRYRKNGLAGMAEVEQYEAERVKRNKRKAERKRLQEAGLQAELTAAEESPAKEEVVARIDLDKITSIVGLPGEACRTVRL